MTEREAQQIEEFREFCRLAADQQLHVIYENEKAHSRDTGLEFYRSCTFVAEMELCKRGLA